MSVSVLMSSSRTNLRRKRGFSEAETTSSPSKGVKAKEDAMYLSSAKKAKTLQCAKASSALKSRSKASKRRLSESTLTDSVVGDVFDARVSDENDKSVAARMPSAKKSRANNGTVVVSHSLVLTEKKQTDYRGFAKANNGVRASKAVHCLDEDVHMTISAPNSSAKMHSVSKKARRRRSSGLEFHVLTGS